MNADRMGTSTDGPLDEELGELLDFASGELGATVRFRPAGHDAARAEGDAVVVEGVHGVHGVLKLAEPPAGDAHAARFLSAIARLVAGRFDRQVEEAEALRARAERVRWVLQADALDVAYQPILDLRANTIVGVEALARFPGNGRVPEEWFAEANAVGLGGDLQLRALGRAVEVFTALPQELYLSVNVSPAVAVLPELQEQLRGLPVDRLVFEITEHDQVSDYDALNRALAPLRRRGLRLAVDDAGAGFASLRHILRIHPDIIKLDMSLIRDIDRDAVLRALSHSISAFGSAIEASVVAEGIETPAELSALRALGVNYGQGYLLQRPVAFDKVDLVRGALTRTRTG